MSPEVESTDVFQGISKNTLLIKTAGEMARRDPALAQRVAAQFRDVLEEIDKALAEKEKENEDEGDSDGPSDEEIYELAHNSGAVKDGELEMDLKAKISQGGDNGCYVQCWLWVDYAGTKWDKDATVNG